MCGPMEAQTKRDQLSVELLVMAGSLMEDECVEFIAADPDDDATLALRVGRLGRIAVDLAALAAAADVLRRLENNLS